MNKQNNEIDNSIIILVWYRIRNKRNRTAQVIIYYAMMQASGYGQVPLVKLLKKEEKTDILGEIIEEVEAYILALRNI
jgi:hypothetical protein